VEKRRLLEKQAETYHRLPLCTIWSATAVPPCANTSPARDTERGQLIRQEQRRDVQQVQVFNDQLPDAASIRTHDFFLPQNTEIDWCWIDFGVGVVMPLRQDTLGAGALWARLLAPWEDLL
jgi:hypothetical protein